MPSIAGVSRKVSCFKHALTKATEKKNLELFKSELWTHGLMHEEVNRNDTKFGDYSQRVWSLFCLTVGFT